MRKSFKVATAFTGTAAAAAMFAPVPARSPSPLPARRDLLTKTAGNTFGETVQDLTTMPMGVPAEMTPRRPGACPLSCSARSTCRSGPWSGRAGAATTPRYLR
jgi:hypothetical protein